jgi:hypothetical protein
MQERAASMMPTQHVYVTYVVRGSGGQFTYTDREEAQEAYSLALTEWQWVRYEVVEKGIECFKTRPDKFHSEECPHCETATYTITRWIDSIGHGMIRCNIILPNKVGDRAAFIKLSAMAKMHNAQYGKPESGHWITGGASVNVTPGMTKWTAVYADHNPKNKR